MLKVNTSSSAIALRRIQNACMARWMSTQTRIVYTKTDEAPALATYSLLPIFNKFSSSSGINFDMVDISVASRILAQFPNANKNGKPEPDNLAALGKLCLKPECNIIKLPNISASVPQLEEAIAELQGKGYDVPNYPAAPKTDAEKATAALYAKVLGSAVNPVLREGNSDRRVAAPVKEYAKKHPHKLLPWTKDVKTKVVYMKTGDFFANEKSNVVLQDGSVKIIHKAADGTVTVLKESVAVKAGEVVDTSSMSVKALNEFFDAEMKTAKKEGMLLSLHLKGTMMKVSDPIMFGHALKTFFKPMFAKHGALLAKAGFNPKNGLSGLAKLSAEDRATIEPEYQESLKRGPALAMVTDDHSNLWSPSDVIIDASMPNVIRDAGCMWHADGSMKETTCIIPDRCYAGIYEEIVNFCRENGAFNVSTMGNVANVGLMAQKAEEYGSHDKTFEMKSAGVVQVVDAKDNVCFETKVGEGDIWRMCMARDAPIQDWVKLAVTRARASGSPAIFWLDANRAHDAQMILKVERYLKDHDLSGLDISIQAPQMAMRSTLVRCKAGKDTISVTGNVLRDYLTDLFPILELGTSAKMLSIVPLMAGGGMYETGAGGSAPKHVQQFVKEGHLRWDSMGEFLAVGASLEDVATRTGNKKAKVLGQALNVATAGVLDNENSPGRKVMQPDNRASHFYLSLYWAEALAAQTEDAELKAQFTQLAAQLRANKEKIHKELVDCQGKPQDIGGYYMFDEKKVGSAMRPSATFNSLLGM